MDLFPASEGAVEGAPSDDRLDTFRGFCCLAWCHPRLVALCATVGSRVVAAWSASCVVEVRSWGVVNLGPPNNN